MSSLGAYIHIPFCTHKCEFCDFAAFAYKDFGHLESDYCEIVLKEISERAGQQPQKKRLSSIFYGGGTPGLIEVLNLSKIHSCLVNTFGLERDAEISLETTPHAINADKIKGWLALGINRLSIGVESFQDSELKAIGRDHSKQQAHQGIACALESGFANLSINLMYSLPTQTIKSWSSTLDELFELAYKHPQINHFSAYGLNLASNSPLFSKFPENSSAYPPEEVFTQMFQVLLEKARSAGFEHYEISNFCKKGQQSRHNLSYWNNSEYLAFGVSAHRYLSGVRSSNWRSLKRYMNDYLGDETYEVIDAKTRINEAIMLSLRLRKGLDLTNFEGCYGIDLMTKFKQPLQKLTEGGFIERSGNCLRITDSGVPVANSIISELLLV